jgi:hypothetical protein
LFDDQSAALVEPGGVLAPFTELTGLGSFEGTLRTTAVGKIVLKNPSVDKSG